MTREPWFWREQSAAARVIKTSLAPLSALYDGAQRLRTHLTTPAKANAPIICVGNASLGGVGKTPFAIALHGLLKTTGLECHFLTRGYGGSARGPVRADPENHDAATIGDETLLLAQAAPTWVSIDRPAGAALAVKNNAKAIIMDDGFQNPTLLKNCSILLVDDQSADENNQVFPAGPMREPLSRAIDRADIVVAVGANEQHTAALAAKLNTPFAAWLAAEGTPDPQPVIAFCGIGKPEKFFATLNENGFTLIERTAFPDHHPYSDQDIDALKLLAKKTGAALITTEKDRVRLPAPFRDEVLRFPVTMRINQPEKLTEMVLTLIDEKSPRGAS